MQEGTDLLIVQATEEINRKQTLRFIDKIINRFEGDVEGKSFGIWGLAFKPNTDDVRDAPAYKVIQNLLDRGAKVRVFDQEAMDNTKDKFGDKIYYADDMYDCIEGVDALVICTEWSVFRTPNFDKIKELLNNHLIFDGRNLYELKEMEELEFEYYSIGRRVVGK